MLIRRNPFLILRDTTAQTVHEQVESLPVTRAWQL